MASFFDPIARRQISLDRPTPVPRPEPVSRCTWGHTWDNPKYDLCPCKHCGISVIFVRVSLHLTGRAPM